MSASQPAWDIPAAWEPALAAARQGGVLFLVGGSDSGKSTLAAVLLAEAGRAGRTAAVVDADVGQSSIGPPTCLSLAFAAQPPQTLGELRPEALEFLGVPSPIGHLLGMAVGVSRLAGLARARGAETVVVDTTGLVDGSVARALKTAEVQLVQPDLVIALQWEDELEHLLQAYRSRGEPAVLRLRPSARVKTRSREQRAARRAHVLADYFRDAVEHVFAWDRVPLENTAWTTGRELPGHLRAHAEQLLGCEVLYAERGTGVFLITSERPDGYALRELKEVYGAGTRAVEAAALPGLLVGLLGARGETLAVGLLDAVRFRERELKIVAPPLDPQHVRALRLGSLRISRDGSQLGFLEPGELG